MPKFTKWYRHMTYIEIEVDADTPEEASAKADEIYNSDDCPSMSDAEYHSETLWDEEMYEIVFEEEVTDGPS